MKDDTPKLTDKRRKQFAMVESEVLRDPTLSAQCKALYALLISYGPDRIFPGHARLAQNLSVNEKSARRWLNELRTHGLIDWKRTGRSNLYEIIGPNPIGHLCPITAADTNVQTDQTPMSDQTGQECPNRSDTHDQRSRSSDPDPSIQIHLDQDEIAKIQPETPEERQARLREKFGEGPLDAMLLATARGAADETSFTVPAHAGGADSFTDGPLTVWCELIGRSRDRLQPSEVTSWAKELGKIAALRGAGAKELAWALRQWQRAIIAQANAGQGERIFTPGNIAWRAPTADFLFAHGSDPNRGITMFLAPMIEYGMINGLADLSFEKESVLSVTEHRAPPPPRAEI